MTRLPTPARPRAARSGSSPLAPLFALLAAALLAVAPAQSLPELLPEGVAVAIGVRDLNAQVDRLQPFLDEAERLGLAESLGAAVPDDAAEGEVPQVPEALAGLTFLDVAGEEAWFVVTASAFQPLPAATVVAQVSDEAADRLRTLVEDAADEPGVQRLEEGGRTLWTYVPPAGAGEEALQLPLGYAVTEEGVAVASTDPEVVRFALRALSGADEASMADGDLYALLSGLGEANTMFMADVLPLTRSLEGLAAGFEAAPLLARLQDALATAGPTVSATTFTDEGVESRSLLVPDPNGPDAALYALLTEGTTAGPEVLAFAPEDATMVAANTFDAAGWWAWLDDVLGSAASLGLPRASELAMMFGLDVQTMLFSWMGDDVVQVYPAASAPEATADPLEGGMGAAQAFLLESTDDAAARQGLDALLRTAATSFGAFAAPQSGSMPMPETVEVAGHEVRRLTLQEGFSVDAAVVDGWALLAFDPEATEAVLSARAEDDAPPAAFAGVASELPADARAWGVADNRAALLGTSEALVSQLQTFAGLGGASELDFDAVDEASADLAAFLEFAAERMGISHGFTVLEGGELRGEGFTEVDW